VSLPQPPEYYNMRGQIWRAYDPSGRTEVQSYDFKGQPLEAVKHIRSAYKTESDWTGSEAYRESLLEMGEPFTTQTTYDALGRVIHQLNPDNSETRPVYHQSGKLNQLYVKLRGSSSETSFVKSITYNARGQREVIEYSDNDARPITTIYEYNDATFRLKTLTTTRVEANGTARDAQALAYVYDPVGNVMTITDNAYDRVFTAGGPVDPVQTYTYDALYRLIEASGREHLALTERPWADTSPDAFKQSRYTVLNDLGQLRNYTRTYAYDKSGNLTQIHHAGAITFNRDIDIHDISNRGIQRRDATPIEQSEFLTAFDANGNQIQIDHLNGLEWNYRDNIAKTVIVNRPDLTRDDAEYYVYDASGQRARKVKETLVSGNVVLEEKIYLGNVEIKHRRDEGSLTNVENRYTHHAMDDKERIATVHYWELHTYTGDYAPALNQNHLRYQFGNHLGSASLELTSDGDIISYEEYFPYGEERASRLVEIRLRLALKSIGIPAKNGMIRPGFTITGPDTMRLGWGGG
jgi:YD repeat-containing protein